MLVFLCSSIAFIIGAIYGILEAVWAHLLRPLRRWKARRSGRPLWTSMREPTWLLSIDREPCTPVKYADVDRLLAFPEEDFTSPSRDRSYLSSSGYTSASAHHGAFSLSPKSVAGEWITESAAGSSSPTSVESVGITFSPLVAGRSTPPAPSSPSLPLPPSPNTRASMQLEVSPIRPNSTLRRRGVAYANSSEPGRSAKQTPQSTSTSNLSNMSHAYLPSPSAFEDACVRSVFLAGDGDEDNELLPEPAWLFATYSKNDRRGAS